MEISNKDITLVKRHLFIIYPWGLIKKPKNRFLPICSPDFTLNSQIWLFYAEKWIFLKNLVLCLKSFYLHIISRLPITLPLVSTHKATFEVQLLKKVEILCCAQDIVIAEMVLLKIDVIRVERCFKWRLRTNDSFCVISLSKEPFNLGYVRGTQRLFPVKEAIKYHLEFSN